FAQEFDRALLGIENAGDGLEHGGLAGAVGAEQRDHLAAGYLEAYASNGLDRTVIALDIAELEDDLGSAHGIVLMRRDSRRQRRDGAAPRKASPSRSPCRSSARSRDRRRGLPATCHARPS